MTRQFSSAELSPTEWWSILEGAFSGPGGPFWGGGKTSTVSAPNGKVGLYSYGITGKIGVIMAEVRKDSMKITIQAPDNPKNMDEYTCEKGRASGPMMGRGERQWDLAWRIFVEGPRGRKDFYADKQGNLIDNPY